MKNKHQYVCINCPLSCSLELLEEKGEVAEVQGAECKIGKKYAEEEFKNPRRMVTTTVLIEGGELPLLPVRSKSSIPKALVGEAVKALADVVVKAPVKSGDIIYPNIVDTGVDIVASRDLPKASS
ncbi:MAG: DUF1667 domain-containing protein [Actinomycetota bacterium]|nr:DUF1667 domain-containing protein [Actinomycetota bacterium]